MMNETSLSTPALIFTSVARSRCHWPVFGFCLFAAVVCRGQTDTSAHDPFWPIGYEPPKPEPVPEVQPTAPVRAEAPPSKPKPAEPVIKPITEKEWQSAQKTLVVSGFTQIRKPGTGETRESVMVNRNMLSVGDTLCITNQNVQFVWRIESLANRDLKLAPVSAARVTATPSTSLKQ